MWVKAFLAIILQASRSLVIDFLDRFLQIGLHVINPLFTGSSPSAAPVRFRLHNAFCMPAAVHSLHVPGTSYAVRLNNSHDTWTPI